MLVTSSIAPHFALFLCSCLAVVPSSRPARADAPRTRAVKAGRRAVLTSCSTAARLRLDGPEHGARIRQVGTPLSDQALAWVLDGAQHMGLELDKSDLTPIYKLSPNSREYLENSAEPGLFYKLM